MDRYAVYLRKSRADEESEKYEKMETLARHERTLLEHAKKLGISITKIYKEIVSGETISSRPEVLKLIEEVEAGLWRGVLVMEIERLARGDTIDQGIVARAFKNGNTKIITPIKTYDPNNEYDEEYFEFGLFMSRREYKTINRRIQRGRIASANEGKAIASTAPYGYEKIKLKNQKGYTWGINETEANVVKTIFNLYNSGFGMTDISNKLDQMGIIPRYTKTWSKSTISDILKNPVYMGKIRWGYRLEKKINKDNTTIVKREVNKNCIYVDGLHTPLISIEEFELSQQIRINNTKKCTKKNLTLQNPLSGLVYCQKCNQLMTRLGSNKKNNYDALKCPNRYCDNISAPIYLIENEIVNKLLKSFTKHKILIDKNILKSHNDNSENLSKIKKTLLEDVDKIKNQISKTYDLLETGIYTTDIFTERNKELSKKLEYLVASIEVIDNEIDKLNQTSQQEKILIPETIELLNLYEKLSNQKRKNELLKKIIDKVYYLKTIPNKRGSLDNANFSIDIITKI